MRVLAIAGLAAAICAGTAAGQTPGADPHSAAPFGMPVMDDHVYVHGLLEQLEGRLGDGGGRFRWDGQAWIGTDVHRLRLKSEGSVDGSGKVDDGLHQALYAHPISTFFDLQAGLRYDLDSRASRGWGAIGIQGLAPQWFEIEATAYASDGGHLAARLQASYDLLLTQVLILQPQLELNAYSKADAARGIGAGLAELDAGLRLRWEITRKIAPYLGITYRDRFGVSAGFARRDGESVDELRVAVGLRLWF